MRLGLDVRAHAAQEKARLQQGQVEASAVEGHQGVEAAEVIAHTLEHVRFCSEITEEVLGETHAAVPGGRDADEEDVGTGSAGEARGFGVQPGDGVPLRAGGAAEVKRVAQWAQAVDAIERPGVGADIEAVAHAGIVRRVPYPVIASPEGAKQSPSAEEIATLRPRLSGLRSR